MKDPRLGSAPIFIDDARRKEWEELEPAIKEEVTRNIARYVNKLENSVSIEILANIIQDLLLRIEKLEQK